MRIVVHVELGHGAGERERESERGGRRAPAMTRALAREWEGAGYVGNLLFAVTARASLVDVVKEGGEWRGRRGRGGEFAR